MTKGRTELMNADGQPAREEIDPSILPLVDAVNAFDAMPTGGTLTLRGAHQDEDCLLEIVDTGHGIKDSEQAKIFRFHYSTKDSGSGVGLSIVKMITEYHGGRVEFESTEGKGSVFTLRFPKGRRDGSKDHHY